MGGSRPPCGGADRNGASLLFLRSATVAPHAGARIETARSRAGVIACAPSPPMRGRGSKPRENGSSTIGSAVAPPCGGADRNSHGLAFFSASPKVAPHAGARIETLLSPMKTMLYGGSPPMRGRGSNNQIQGMIANNSTSPPMRGRGSKPLTAAALRATPGSPPMRGRGSKHLWADAAGRSAQSPPMRGRGSKPRRRASCEIGDWSPPMRGRGSKQ